MILKTLSGLNCHEFQKALRAELVMRTSKTLSELTCRDTSEIIEINFKLEKRGFESMFTAVSPIWMPF